MSSQPPAARQGQPVPSGAGAQRRLRALAARSWSPRAIEWETGVPAPLIWRGLQNRDEISPDAARTIAAAYEQLWDRDPPRGTQQDRDAADTIRVHATQRGWAPPLAWDDDQIDLPGGRPAAGWKPSKRSSWRAADLVEDAEFVREHGGYQNASASQVATRLGVSRDRLEQAHSRVRRRSAARNARAEAEPEAEAG
jgi:hypothetical protein